jgi:hypothetical protein
MTLLFRTLEIKLSCSKWMTTKAFRRLVIKRIANVGSQTMHIPEKKQSYSITRRWSSLKPNPTHTAWMDKHLTYGGTNAWKISQYVKLGYLRTDKGLWFWKIIFLGRALSYNFTQNLFIYPLFNDASLVHRVPIHRETEEYFINHELERM